MAAIVSGLLLALASVAPAQDAADPGWPRVFTQGPLQLTIYQPQVDYWHGYTNLHFRCAIAVKGVLKQEKYGVAEIDAVTVTDQPNRIVALVPIQREIRFPNVSDAELAQLRAAVDQIKPSGEAVTISLDRVIACLTPDKQTAQPPVELNLNPPKIFYSSVPAVLVIFMGEPRLQPVATNRTDLMFALNTNWDILYDTASQRYFLLDRDIWLVAPDVKGPWILAGQLPASLSTLPADDNWAQVRANIPGQRAKQAPVVYVSTQPAELIVTDGPAGYRPVKGTRLMQVVNTDSVVFLNSGDTKFYFLVAGRWFRAPSLDGPWSAASADLPADFAQIPDNDPAAFVKASVPGTRDAQDAILLASIPTTTTVQMTNPTVSVIYSGKPDFVEITNTTVQYAVNTPNAVFLVSGKYYCCDQGVWFVSGTATGSWTFCTSVPAAIYTIPPSNPHYNVTYVVVQSSTPTTVTYSATSGYSGEYVARTGVLMFGVGMLVGAAIANNHDHYYYPPYPCHYSYGCGACYHYGYGGYYSRGGGVYGPYGGASYSASYNPSSGTYTRSSSAYGPYGSASRYASYNPYTGNAYASAQRNTAYGSAGAAASYNRGSGQYSASAYRTSAYGTTTAQRNYNAYTGQSSASRQVNTAYGTASQGAAYDAQTGARAAGGSVNTAYGSASRGAAYNPTTGEGAAGRTASGQYGTAGTVKTTGGGSMSAWNTQHGEGAVGKTSSGDIYASNGDSVYKRDSDGSWSQNSGSGWESTTKPQPQNGSYQQRSSGQSNWSQQRSSMESQAQSRSWGNQQSQRTQSWQRSGGFEGGGGWGGSRGGGGRRR